MSTLSVVEISSSQTIDASSGYVLFIVDCTSQNVTLDMQEINSSDGIYFRFMRKDSTGNTLTIVPHTNDTIHGGSILMTGNQNVGLCSLGNTWYNIKN